jgi:hypothetical protein
MKLLLVALVTIALSGCITDPVRDKVAGAYDVGLEKAEGFICNDASIGSIIRKYGISSDRAKAWKDFCFGKSALDIATDKN